MNMCFIDNNFCSQLSAFSIALFVMISSFNNQIYAYLSGLDQNNVKLGAYYFDGWNVETNHISQSLKYDFKDRMPKGGWITSTPKRMETQINDAAKSSIFFFSICWYYVNSDSTVFKNHPLNRAVSLFVRAQNRKKLEFNLLVANHAGSVVRPMDWEIVATDGIAYFKNPIYLSNTITIDSLRIAVLELWDTFRSQKLPYISAITLKWDPRSWCSINPSLSTSKRYDGYSAKSVFDIVRSLGKWTALNADFLTQDRIAMIYAWNEYGEGAWLTPSKNDRSFLNGLRKALAN